MFLFYFLLIILLITSYSYIILKRSLFPVINLYLIINIIIFYLPALVYVIFGLTHPSTEYNLTNKFNYEDIFIYGIILVIFFDLTILLSYFVFNKKLNFSFITNIKNISITNNFLLFYIITFSSIIFFDFIDILGNNSLMNKDYISCNKNLAFIVEIKNSLNSFAIIQNFKQVVSEFTNLKYYLLIITIYYYQFYKSKYFNILIYIILFYVLINAIIIGSKFSLALIPIVYFCIYYNYFLKLKNIIFTGIIFYLSLYIFPLMGSIRAFYTKPYKSEDCLIIENKVKYIVDHGFRYNNISLNKDVGVISQYFDSTVVPDLITQQSFLNKPMEIILTRLNYFDITLRSINLKLNNFVKNDLMYYFDNIYALIPRIFFPDKKIISNNSNYLAVDLGVIKEPINAVGLRPIAEGFYYLGYYYFIIAIVLGFIFFIINKLFQSTNIIVKSSALYMGILILKRDSFHSLIPGLVHELIMMMYLIIICYTVNIYNRKTRS